MKEIIIGFSTPTPDTIYSWGIRSVWGTEFSHTYIRFMVAGEDTVFEANDHCVKFVNAEQWDKDNQVICSYPFYVSDKMWENVISYCHSISGTPYGFKQAAGLLLATILGMDKNPFGDGNDTQICSEVVYRIVTEVFKYRWNTHDDDMVTPYMCQKYISYNHQLILSHLRKYLHKKTVDLGDFDDYS
jgi:hypothetical protein